MTISTASMSTLTALRPATDAAASTRAPVGHAEAQTITPEVTTPKPVAETEKLEPAVIKQWQEQLQSQRKLEFSIDSDSGRDVVKVLDGESGDVIRQFPSEEVLQLSRAAKAGKGGLFAGEA